MFNKQGSYLASASEGMSATNFVSVFSGLVEPQIHYPRARTGEECAFDPCQCLNWSSIQEHLEHANPLTRRNLNAPLSVSSFNAGNRGRGVQTMDMIQWDELSTGSMMSRLSGRIIGTVTEIFLAIRGETRAHTLEELGDWTLNIWNLVSILTSNDHQVSDMFHQLVTCGGEKSLRDYVAIDPGATRAESRPPAWKMPKFNWK